MHRLLERQIKRYFGKTLSIDNIDENLLNLLKDVSQTYTDNDIERKFLENTITVNTEELNTLLRGKSSLLESRTQENQEVINLLHQYKKAIDSSLIISMTDVNGIIKYANDNFCNTSGYSKEELIGNTHNILRDYSNQDSLYSDLWNTINDKKMWNGTFSNLKKSGETYYINMTIVPLLYRENQIKEYMSLSEDVTQQVVYQKKLDSQRERINTIFNAQENVVVIVDEKDGIVDANRRFFEVFKFKDLEDYKRNIKNISSLFEKSEEYISEDISESQWFKQFFQKSDHLHKLIKIDNINEQIFSIHCRSAFLEDKLHYLCTFIDITELESARKKAEIAQQAKSTFLANMSHEIRTPLNAIIGFSDILYDSELNPKDKENALIISKSAKSLLGIINDVLDISKMESGKLELLNEVFLFESFIEHIVELFSVNTKEKKIKFVYKPETSLPYSVISDSTKLQQVLSNLLSNAIKFTPQDGEIIFTIKVLDVNDNEVKIYFSIKDSGIGMTNEQQKIIFNPFMQADDGISRKYGGTGLGLAICADIIKLMNSEIKLESIPNEGSEFSFVINFKVDKFKIEQKVIDKNKNINEFFTKQPKSIDTSIGKVLVAEDNPTNQKLIEILLSKMGVETLIVSNGEEAVESYKKEKYDLIFMDINMPVMDGITATKIIKDLEKDNYKVPIVVLTANSIAGDKEKYLAEGMDDYLSKPIATDKLISILKKYLADEIKKETIPEIIKYSYNKQQAVNFLGLDELIVDMLLDSFFLTLDGDIKKIQNAIDSKNVNDIISSSHYLKGACANLVMTEASEILKDIETRAKLGETNFNLSMLNNYFEQIRIN